MEIESPSNPLIKRVRKLRRSRKPGDPSLVEGTASVAAAMAAGSDIEMVLLAPELVTGEGGGHLVDEIKGAGHRVVTISGEAFRSFSARDAPTGIAALVQGRPVPLAELEITDRGVIVALHEVGTPGNLGTIVRTAVAARCEGLVLVGASTDPFGSEAVKASMGTIFSMPVAFCAELEELFKWSRRRGASVIATSAHCREVLWEAALSLPCVLLFGSERRGLPDHALSEADGCVGIPMSGTAGSLNLAVAAGIVIFDLTRPGRATQ